MLLVCANSNSILEKSPSPQSFWAAHDPRLFHPPSSSIPLQLPQISPTFSNLPFRSPDILPVNYLLSGSVEFGQFGSSGEAIARLWGGRWPNSREKHRGKTSRDALYIANPTNAKLTANSYLKLLFFFRFSLRCCCALLLRPLGSCTQARFLHSTLSPPPASSLQPPALPAASISPSPSPPPTNFGDPASVIFCEAGHLLVCRSAPNHAWRDDLLPPLDLSCPAGRQMDVSGPYMTSSGIGIAAFPNSEVMRGLHAGSLLPATAASISPHLRGLSRCYLIRFLSATGLRIDRRRPKNS